MLFKQLLCIGLGLATTVCLGQKPNGNTASSSKPKVLATSLVDPYIGSDYGNTFVGAALPFSLCKPGPDVVPPYNTAGYNANAPIEGFSHTHLSGTGGGGRYGNIMLTPLVGGPDLKTRAGFRNNEIAKAGYYAVTINRRPGEVKTELTLTPRAAWHRYTFHGWAKSPTVEATLMVDPVHVISRKRDSLDSRCTGYAMRVNDHGDLEGHANYAGGWGGQNPYTVHFYIETNIKPFASGQWVEDSVFREVQTHSSGKIGGMYLRFNLKQDQQLLVKVGISFKNGDDARLNLYERRGWDFEATRFAAAQTWENLLGKIKIEGGLPEQQILFYTNLYHTFLMPHDHSGQNPNWPTDQPTFWDHYCLWDVFRSVMPLHTLIAPEWQRKMVLSLLDVARHTGWFPDAWVAGGHAQQQGGTNSDVVLTDAVIKGIIKPNETQLLDTIWKYSYKNTLANTDKPGVYGRYITEMEKYGYLPADIKCGTSITAEVSYDDYCLSVLAKKLGHKQEAARLEQNSRRIWNLFKQDTGYLWAKDRYGNWLPNINPAYKRPDSWNGPHFYEGTPWAYTYYMPHLMPELVKRRGGNALFTQWLDRFFDEGHFELENEPLFLVPYLFNYASRPDKTAQRVRKILNHEFSAGRKGLPGQDDSGAISSWYVWSSLGLFPVAGQDLYLIGSPVWSKSSLPLGNGKTLTIIADGAGPEAIYVKSVRFNNRKLTKPEITHTELAQGGTLTFTMTDRPVSWVK